MAEVENKWKQKKREEKPVEVAPEQEVKKIEGEDTPPYNLAFVQAYYFLKIDLVTNSLSRNVRKAFARNNATGQRLAQLDKWKTEYINKQTRKVPKEVLLVAKELKMYE